MNEIVSAFQSADGDINGAITALASTATSGLSTEVARAESAEASLDVAKLNLAGGTMTGNIDMNGNNVLGANAVTTNFLGATVGDLIRLESSLDFDDSSSIINLPAPTNDGDAANKLYVDSALSTEESARLAAEASITAELSSDIEALADVDGTTIVLNGDTNQIELKESIAAPASGIRTFAGEVDVETILKVGGVDVMATISSEVSARISGDESLAEELSSEVSYLIANTDLGSIDSFAEVVADLSSEIARAESVEASIAYLTGTALQSEVTRAQSAESSLQARVNAEYFQKVGVNESVDGIRAKFSFDKWSKQDSESIFLNGLLMTVGEDYSIINAAGHVFGIEFMSAPAATDRVKAYGVYGQDAHDVAYYENLISDLQSQKQQAQADKAQAQANGDSTGAAYYQGLIDQYNEQIMTLTQEIAHNQNVKQNVAEVIHVFELGNGGNS